MLRKVGEVGEVGERSKIEMRDDIYFPPLRKIYWGKIGEKWGKVGEGF